MNFQSLKLSDAELIRPYFLMQSARTCDNTLGCVLMWRGYFDTCFALEDDTLVFKFIYGKNKEPAFGVPMGKNIIATLQKIKEYCFLNGIPPLFCGATNDDIAVIRTVFPDCEVIPEREWFDYVYDCEDLKNFSGRRYNGQRNHVNKFRKLYPDFRFEIIDSENISIVRDFYLSHEERHSKHGDTADAERTMVLEVLDNFSLFGLCGGFLSTSEGVAAFAVGEQVNDVLFVHIEKADIEFAGAYQVIVSEFAKAFADESVKFINREEDLGDEGLRTSKLSYHPVMLIEKNFIRG